MPKQVYIRLAITVRFFLLPVVVFFICKFMGFVVPIYS